jgi:hypothetical protein
MLNIYRLKGRNKMKSGKRRRRKGRKRKRRMNRGVVKVLYLVQGGRKQIIYCSECS